MQNFIKNNTKINNVFEKDIKNNLKEFTLIDNKKSDIHFIITKKFIRENFNNNFNVKSGKVLGQSFVKETLIGCKSGVKFEVIKGTLADTFQNFFNNSNVKKITKACNNTVLLLALYKFNNEKDIINLDTIDKFMVKSGVSGYVRLDKECQKKGKFSKQIKATNEAKKPSGATNQAEKSDNESKSIEQELKVNSKNNAINLLAEVYPSFYSLNSKDKQLVITMLSNAKNLSQDLPTFNQVLKAESKKLAI